MAICTKEEVKTYIYGTTTPTTYDALFTQLIAQAQKNIERITSVRITAVSDAYDDVENEIVNSIGICEIRAKSKPIRTITKVETRQSDFSFSQQTTQSESEMEVDGRSIYTSYSVASKGQRNIRLTYTAGYKEDEVPDDLKLAAIMMVVGLFNKRESVGYTSQNVLGLNLAISNEQAFEIENILNKYKDAYAY